MLTLVVLQTTNVKIVKELRSLASILWLNLIDAQLETVFDPLQPAATEHGGEPLYRSESMFILIINTTIISFYLFHISVYSFVELAPILLSMDGVGYFLSEKLSQDYLEEYFSKHRGRGGCNDNPTTYMFGHQFNSLHVAGSAAVRATLGMCKNTKREEDATTSQHMDGPLPKRPRTKDV